MNKFNTKFVKKFIAINIVALLLMQPFLAFATNQEDMKDKALVQSSQLSSVEEVFLESVALGESGEVELPELIEENSEAPVALGESRGVTPFADGVSAVITNQILIDGKAWMSNNSLNPMYKITEVMTSISPANISNKTLKWLGEMNIEYPVEGIFIFPKTSTAGDPVTIELIPTMNGVGTFTLTSAEDPTKSAVIEIAGDTKSAQIQELKVIDATVANRISDDKDKQLVLKAEDVIYAGVRSGLDQDNLYYITTTGTETPMNNIFEPNGTDGWTRYIEGQENIIVPPASVANGEGFYVHVAIYDLIGNRRREIFRGNDYDWTSGTPQPDPEPIIITKAEGLTASTTLPLLDGKYYIKGGESLSVKADLLPVTLLEKSILWANDNTSLIATLPAESQSGGGVTATTNKGDGKVRITATAKAQPYPTDGLDIYVDSTPPTFTQIHVEEIPTLRDLVTSNNLKVILGATDPLVNNVAVGVDEAKIYYKSSVTQAPSFDPSNPTADGWKAYLGGGANLVDLPTNGETFYLYAVAVDKVGNVSRPYAFGEIIDQDGNTGVDPGDPPWPGGEEGGEEIPIVVIKATDINVTIIGQKPGAVGDDKSYIKGGESVFARGAVTPANTPNKQVHWTVDVGNTLNIDIEKAITNGSNDPTKITSVVGFNGLVPLVATADAEFSPSKTNVLYIDSTAPDVGTIETEIVTDLVSYFPVKVIFSASDPTVSGVSSGVNNKYYTSSLIDNPAFDPANPASGHWKTYREGQENYVESLGDGMEFYLVVAVVDYAGNFITQAHSEKITINIDREPPQLNLPIQHTIVGAGAMVLPSLDATAWDSVDKDIIMVVGNNTLLEPLTLTIDSNHTVGVEKVLYKVKDATGNFAQEHQSFYVHGTPTITANSVKIHWRDTPDMFDLIEEKQIIPRATAQLVLGENNIQEYEIPREELTRSDISLIPWGQVGQTGQVTYTTNYNHPYLNIPFPLTVTIDVEIVGDKVPGAPEIELKAGASNPEWFYIGTSSIISINDFWNKVEITEGTASISTRRASVEDIATGNTLPFSNTLRAPGEYETLLKVIDTDGRSAYLELGLNVVDAIAVTPRNPQVVHAIVVTGGVLPEVDYTGANGYQGTFLNHKRELINAIVTNPSNISISTVGAQNLNYMVSYPPEYLGAPAPISRAHTLRVHGDPQISVANPITTYTLDDTRGNFMFFEDSRIELAVTAQYVDENNQIQSFDFNLPQTTYMDLIENVQFDTLGDYPVTYGASYQVPGWNIISNSENTMFHVVEGHDPTMPQITGEGPIRYFMGFTDATALENEIMNRVVVTNQAGESYPEAVLTFSVLKGSITLPNWKDALNSPREYTIRYQAIGTSGHAAYHEIKLQVIGALAMENPAAIDAFTEVGEVLDPSEYSGDNAPIAYFRDYDGILKAVTVSIANENGSSGIPIGEKGYQRIRYTAKYPLEYQDETSKNYTIEKLRLVRVHGVPVILNGADLELRTPRTAAERDALVQTLEQNLNQPGGITGTIELMGINFGDSTVVKEVVIEVVFNPFLNLIQKVPITYTASYTLPAGYNPIEVSTIDDSHMATLHGNVEVRASNLKISINYDNDDFINYAETHMNLTASVKYYNPANPLQPIINTIPISVASYIGTIGFGVASPPLYPVAYKADDSTAGNRPVGLPPKETTKIVIITIANLMGTAPVIHDIPEKLEWLDTVIFSEIDALYGIFAEDDEDGTITPLLKVKVEDSANQNIDITNANTQLAVGEYTVFYTVRDSQGDTAEESTKLYIHSLLNTIVTPPIETILRAKSVPYRPNLAKLELNYQDGTINTGNPLDSIVHVTKQSHPNLYRTDQTTYDINTPKEITYYALVTHPVFGEAFVRPSTRESVDTTVKHTMVLKVYGYLRMTGYEKYNAKELIRHLESYFIAGNSTVERDLLVGVTATREAPSGNGAVLEEMPIKLTANGFNMATPNTFTALYTASDPVFAGDMLQSKISVQVDSLPMLATEENPVFVQSGASLETVMTEAKVSAVIYYGDNPTVAVPIGLTQAKLMDTNTNTELEVVGPIEQAQHLYLQGVHPNVATAIAELTVPVIPLKKPVITFADAEDVIIFRNETTIAELAERLSPVYIHYDKDGNEIKQPANMDFSHVDLTKGGIYKVNATLTEPQTGLTITSEDRFIYVLNRAYIRTMPLFNIYNADINHVTKDDIFNIIIAVGVGERLEENTGITARDGSGAPKRIVSETYSIDKDLDNVSLDIFEKKQEVKLSGAFWFENQQVESRTAVVLHKAIDTGTGGGSSSGSENSEGTTKPDETLNKPGGEGGSQPEDVEESGFWRATESLLLDQKKKGEGWKITARSYKKPAKIDTSGSRVVALPENQLQMPRYITKALEEQSQTSLQLDLGDYYWQLHSDTNWKETTLSHYYIGITQANNQRMLELLGTKEAQQIHFGFAGGWNTIAQLGVRITNKSLLNKTLYMYYYNPNRDTLEMVGQMKYLNNQWYSVSVRGEYGDYIISNKLLDDARVMDSENPATGGFNEIYYAKDMLLKDTPLVIEDKGVSRYSFLKCITSTWGVLAILGIVLAWIVYFIVRRLKSE